MKQNGIYTAFVAILALFLLSSGIFTAKIQVEQDNGLNSNIIINTQSDWQNVRYLMDKTTSDAIYDVVSLEIIKNGTCTAPNLPANVYEGKEIIYFNGIFNSLGSSQNLECGFSALAVDFNPVSQTAKIDTEFKLYCKKSGGPFSEVSFEDNVLIKKEIVTDNSAGCVLSIKDSSSEIVEISATKNADGTWESNMPAETGGTGTTSGTTGSGTGLITATSPIIG